MVTGRLTLPLPILVQTQFRFFLETVMAHFSPTLTTRLVQVRCQSLRGTSTETESWTSLWLIPVPTQFRFSLAEATGHFQRRRSLMKLVAGQSPSFRSI